MAMQLDGILARLDRLEAENASLRDQVQRLRGGEGTAGSDPGPGAPDAGVTPTDTPGSAVSRRQLLRRAGVTAVASGVVAFSAATLGRTEAARAGSGDTMLIGRSNDTATNVTYLENRVNDKAVFVALSDGTGTAVTGSSHSGTGVTGGGARGGYFRGTKAAINLAPSAKDGHPHKGFLGDIVLDKTFRLWVCKGGTHWKQLG